MLSFLKSSMFPRPHRWLLTYTHPFEYADTLGAPAEARA